MQVKPTEATTGAARRVVASSRGSYAVVLVCFIGTLVSIPLQAAVFSMLLAVVGIAALAVADLRALLILSFPTYALIGALASVVLIERGAYISEQSRYGFSVGASPALAAYTLAFLGLAHFTVVALMRSLGSAKNIDPTPFRNVLIAGSLVVALFYAITFFLYGTGLGFSDLRFGWARTLSPVFNKIHGLLGMFALPAIFGLAGFYWAYFQKRELWFLFLALPPAALVLTGEKFSGFLSAIAVGLAGAGIAGYVARRRFGVQPSRLIVAFGIGVVLLVSVALGYQRAGSGNILEAISTRIVLQGHVWFGIFELFRGAPGVSATDLIRGSTLANPAGLDLLSYLIADPLFVYQRIAAGVTFTMGGPPSSLAAFGLMPGLMVYALGGLAYAMVARLAASCFSKGRVIVGTVALAYFVILGLTTQMGRWDVAFGTVASACYLVLAWEWVRWKLEGTPALAFGTAIWAGIVQRGRR